MSALNNPSTSTDQNDPNENKSKTPKSKGMHLPISRVRTIMKSTPDIENIGLPALHVVTKATELFIQKLVQDALKGQRHLKYNDLAKAVEENENMDFLREVLPKKITMAEYYKLVGKESSEVGEDNDNGSQTAHSSTSSMLSDN
ncbi:chromatin accessibility complex protein 1-like isoform X1 [Aphis gossypii]|uniref:chromatin accessibility complex protein 1-like isoform X1 n=1 Tax=Aphis gossypii TaxID=80765 RepID=UPI00215991B6|nr:chromatin accessibility complex protein 1-like isoform X1 [Aphis gossypii]